MDLGARPVAEGYSGISGGRHGPRSKISGSWGRNHADGAEGWILMVCPSRSASGESIILLTADHKKSVEKFPPLIPPQMNEICIWWKRCQNVMKA